MATVLVIGASRGIGLEFAHQYAQAGERVLATARDDAGLRRLKDLGATAIKLDVSDPASAAWPGSLRVRRLTSRCMWPVSIRKPAPTRRQRSKSSTS
jgi:NAD(P)-dependent dehydrogenase (short-subunit alcohol dehydrogenase family)